MQHLDEGTIHAWLDDALPAEDAARVAAHVAACAQCTEAVAEARGLIAAASRIVHALDDVPADVIPLSSRPASGPASGPALHRVAPLRHARPWYRQRVVSAAAGFVVMAAGATVVARMWRTGASPTASADRVAAAPMMSSLADSSSSVHVAGSAKDSAAGPAVPPTSTAPRSPSSGKPLPDKSLPERRVRSEVFAMGRGAPAASEMARAALPAPTAPPDSPMREVMRDAAPMTGFTKIIPPPESLKTNVLRLRGISARQVSGSRRPTPLRQITCDSADVAEYDVDGVVVTLASGRAIPSSDTVNACLARQSVKAKTTVTAPERRNTVARPDLPVDTLTWRSPDGQRGYRLEGRATRAELEHIRDILKGVP